MIAFPAAAAILALACAGYVGWDAMRRPRPDRVTWVVAFLVFAVAASAEVLGATLGWNPVLARVYYLAGAVLVVGILALGELYLLWPDRMPVFAPGIALLVVAIAATAVWSAPVDASRLQVDGWHAIERGPFLVALAASINAGGTLVLVGGALYSAVKLRATAGSSRRASGCALIAVGTVVVALGGTLTRFGRPEYLYLAMATGIAIIFAGVLLTRTPVRQVFAHQQRLNMGEGTVRGGRLATMTVLPRPGLRRGAIATLSAYPHPNPSPGSTGEGLADPEIGATFTMPPPVRQPGVGERSPADIDGLRFIADKLLPLDDIAIAEACRRWSATPIEGDALTREQARIAWAVRLLLPESAKDQFDRLPLIVQAQVGEPLQHVWSSDAQTAGNDDRAGGRRSLAILRPKIEGEGEVR